MQFFIDTANLDEIKQAHAMGVLDGVTTNPSLVAKEGDIDFHAHLKTICELVQGPVSAEVVSVDCAGMLKEARELVKISPHIVIKLPIIEEGIKACVALSKEGVKTNLTLCFSPSQALIVAKAGATYVSPFIGRLDDISIEGIQLIADIREIYDNYGFDTQILAASIRHPLHVVDCARLGADVATIPFKVIGQLLKHPLTDSGLEKFLADWKKTGN